ncbi:glycerophosphodiester phosphodiesterase [Xylophilus sp. GW821-FHT01B05]
MKPSTTAVASAKHRWWLWLLVPFLLLGLLLSLSDVLYQRAAAQARAFPFSGCQKVWGHRGYAATGGENSLQGVQEAFRRGAAGVEIDILFDRELDDFVVSHDRPYTLFGGHPLRLESVLSQYTGTGFFWLDAKDLRRLSPMAAHKATQRLAALIRRYQLTERAFVESSNALYVSWLAGQGIHTSYAVSPNDQKYSAPLYQLNAALMKLAYAFSGADAISMDVSRYTPVTAASFGGAAVLLSTVNDADALQHLSAIPEVKVILSDDDHYAISACTRPGAP